MEGLANTYATSLPTLRKLLKRNNVTIRNRGNIEKKIDQTQIEQLRTMWRADRPLNEICEHFNLSIPTLYRWLRQIGEKLHRQTRTGDRHGNWKGGSYLSNLGYKYILLDKNDPLYSMANSMGYVADHRYVMAKTIDRPLKRSEQVHHINGIKTDNRFENLQLRVKPHGNGVVCRCLDCGSTNICYDEIPE